VFGETLAYLHRHNRVALTSTIMLAFVAAVQALR
jgi:hypothetical protein